LKRNYKNTTVILLGKKNLGSLQIRKAPDNQEEVRAFLIVCDLSNGQQKARPLSQYGGLSYL